METIGILVALAMLAVAIIAGITLNNRAEKECTPKAVAGKSYTNYGVFNAVNSFVDLLKAPGRIFATEKAGYPGVFWGVAFMALVSFVLAVAFLAGNFGVHDHLYVVYLREIPMVGGTIF